MLTDTDLDAIRERLEKATPGPWERDEKWNETAVYNKDGVMVAGQWDYEEGGVAEVPDAEFIAHAPTDIANLLAEVERLRAELNQYRTKLSSEDAQAFLDALGQGVENAD